MSDHIIYKYTAPNGKSYIGLTMNMHRRVIMHRNTSGCRAFSAAIKKYGWDSFTKTILAEGLTLEEANARDIELIAEHNTLSPHGYNLRPGGNAKGASDETRAKLSEARKGWRMSDAQKARLSELGKQISPERIKLMVERAAQARAARAGQPHHNLGRKHTDEARRKISAASKEVNARPDVREKLNKARTGRKNSVETRAKMSESAKRRWSKTREGAG